ncbi:hypothetical protein SKAU_G00314550 [Synaphobranchus kaupii]|uniref:Uncharacterized protein n=1 Tax=Synaphobranchus kaupii TaxID=118154 RepID=A0A9Q1IKM2_SYNKA|nr:hypothetical protein SKAU_G00314550 [Synaphobranchus kaupii]
MRRQRTARKRRLLIGERGESGPARRASEGGEDRQTNREGEKGRKKARRRRQRRCVGRRRTRWSAPGRETGSVTHAAVTVRVRGQGSAPRVARGPAEVPQSQAKDQRLRPGGRRLKLTSADSRIIH